LLNLKTACFSVSSAEAPPVPRIIAPPSAPIGPACARAWLLLAVLVFVIVWFLYSKYFKQLFSRIFEIDEVEIGIGSHKIKIRPNYEDLQIVYNLWLEMSTRKLGLEIDLDNDVINEIYRSWYNFFQLTRDVTKDIPVSKIRRNESTKEIVRVAIEVLNEGVRPHLTKWQARFRKWYNEELEREENRELSPQDIQRRFPEYDRLTKDMIEVNHRLIKYRKILRRLAMGE
jgi:hypothetical protein